MSIIVVCRLIYPLARPIIKKINQKRYFMNVKLFFHGVCAMAMLGVLASTAHGADVTIGYQTIPNPAQIAQDNGDYDKATQVKLDWRKFDTGADVITAVASGDVQIAYLGSSPFTVAASRNVPIETILVAANL